MKKKNITLIFSSLLFIIFISGIYAHCTPRYYELTHNMSEILLFSTNIFVLAWYFIEKFHWKTLLWSILLLLITFGIEAYGVASGNVFGEYQYGAVFSFQILDVPVLIALNWIVLTMAAANIGKKMVKNPYLAALIGGVMVLIFDIIMEPVAISLDYWKWEAPNVPLQNYLAWFLIGTIGSFVLLRLGKMRNCQLLKAYFFAQLLFFLGVNFCI